MIKRTMKVTPGYDCRTECKHEPKGDHGIAGDEWWYTVTDGRVAVSLQVLTNAYPPSVDQEKIPPILRGHLAGTLAFHRPDPEGCTCDLVPGGKCSLEIGFGTGARFWKEHGDPAQSEQPETFWAALEAELRDFRGD